ncbi:MAG TPA: hypothetical protein VE709_06980 [Pseudonocardiaceae bacterium]|nr:hypothetical protein [Pseudonocardiaceae bacterium]
MTTRRSDTRFTTSASNRSWSISPKKLRISNSTTWVTPSMNPTRSRSIACVTDRRGRNPYDTDEKSASKIGSNTSFAAACATRSRTVGMPSGRLPPSGFGMSTRLAGAGRYVPARSSARSSESIRSTP